MITPRCCPGCGQELATKLETAMECSGRTRTYRVLDMTDLVFCYGGRYWHKGCANPANVQDWNP